MYWIIVFVYTYIYSGIVNGARCYTQAFEYAKRKDKTEKLIRIWVVFPSASTGSLLREVPKIRIKCSRSQFPMVLCFCMTSYKSQGQTLDNSILDFKDAISKHGLFYVGITRVRSAAGIFVRNFAPSQVQCREDVKKELKILQRNKQYKFSKTYLKTKVWENKSEFKIGYLNINGLHHNLNNFDKDSNLANLDFICIAETKLESKIDTEAINNALGKVQILRMKKINSNIF